MARLTMVGEDRLSGRNQLPQIGSNRKQVMENFYGTGYGIGNGTGSAMWHLVFFGVWYLCYLIVIIKGVTHQSARFML